MSETTWRIEIDPRSGSAGYSWAAAHERRSDLAGLRITTSYGGWEPSYRKARRRVRSHLRRWGVRRRDRP